MAVSTAKRSSVGASLGKGRGARGGMGVTFEGLDEAIEALAAVDETVLFMDRLRPRITSDSPYFLFVTEGTRPHVIEPLRAKALSWPGARHPVRRLMHPGTTANPFHERAWTRYEPEFNTRIENALERAAAGRDARASRQEIQLAYNRFVGVVKEESPKRTRALERSIRLLLEGGTVA